MRHLTLLLAFLASAGLIAADAPKSNSDDVKTTNRLKEAPEKGDADKAKGGTEKLPELEGTYMLVSGERDGKPIPEEKIKGAMHTFKGNTIVGVDKDKKEIYVSTFKIDTATKPMKIMMESSVPAKAKTTGLIEVDGITVKIIYALPGKGEEPKGFKTEKDQLMFVLKRVDRPVLDDSKK